MLYFLLALCLAVTVRGHGQGTWNINPALGVPGYPDCVQPNAFDTSDVEANAMSLQCFQRQGKSAAALKVGCVGDSITAGAHSSGPTKTYPSQLQAMLDPAKYAVTNLGACGSTMQKHADSPYWNRPQYQTLINNTWDIIVIMLGTNDAKDTGDGGPNNWLDNCGPSLNALDLTNCSFAIDFASMIEVVRGLGTTAAGPIIYAAIPPPLMAARAIGANQTVINSVYPLLVPMIHDANKLTTKPVDIFTAMGGTSNWANVFPSSCQLNSPWADCAWWCDAQSCDQCHPNDNGYGVLAKAMKAGLNLV